MNDLTTTVIQEACKDIVKNHFIDQVAVKELYDAILKREDMRLLKWLEFNGWLNKVSVEEGGIFLQVVNLDELINQYLEDQKNEPK